MGSLIVCSHCHRHAKRQERQCPFCGTALSTSPGSRAGLAAAFVVGLGMSMVGCGDDVETDGDGGAGVGGMLTAYGPAPGGWGGYGTGGDGGFAGGQAPAYGPSPGGFGGTAGSGGTGGDGGSGG